MSSKDMVKNLPPESPDITIWGRWCRVCKSKVGIFHVLEHSYADTFMRDYIYTRQRFLR